MSDEQHWRIDELETQVDALIGERDGLEGRVNPLEDRVVELEKVIDGIPPELRVTVDWYREQIEAKAAESAQLRLALHRHFEVAQAAKALVDGLPNSSAFKSGTGDRMAALFETVHELETLESELAADERRAKT